MPRCAACPFRPVCRLEAAAVPVRCSPTTSPQQPTSAGSTTVQGRAPHPWQRRWWRQLSAQHTASLRAWAHRLQCTVCRVRWRLQRKRPHASTPLCAACVARRMTSPALSAKTCCSARAQRAECGRCGAIAGGLQGANKPHERLNARCAGSQPADWAATALKACRFDCCLFCFFWPANFCCPAAMHFPQHSECVLQQLKPGPGMNPIPGRAVRETFLCEMCRWSRTDPFWEVVQGDIVPPATLKKNGKQGQVRGRRPWGGQCETGSSVYMLRFARGRCTHRQIVLHTCSAYMSCGSVCKGQQLASAVATLLGCAGGNVVPASVDP